jgi:hypothetical protein
MYGWKARVVSAALSEMTMLLPISPSVSNPCRVTASLPAMVSEPPIRVSWASGSKLAALPEMLRLPSTVDRHSCSSTSTWLVSARSPATEKRRSLRIVSPPSSQR